MARMYSSAISLAMREGELLVSPSDEGPAFVRVSVERTGEHDVVPLAYVEYLLRRRERWLALWATTHAPW